MPDRVSTEPSFAERKVTRVVNSSSALPGSICISPDGKKLYVFRYSDVWVADWNGSKWVQVPSPNPAGPVSEIGLNGVTATSASDAWAVGTYTTGTMDKTLIEHWNGTAWKLVASPNPEPRDDLNAVVATSAGNAWAVGFRGTSEQTLIVRWNGTAWKVVPGPSPGQSSDLAGVAAPSAASVWAVGNYSAGGVTQVLAAHCC